jgi:predicted ribonuclease YlaK
MHYQRLDEVLWVEVLGAWPVRIILPICVIDELDNKKYTGSDRMSRRAHLAITALREYSAGMRPGSAATLPDGTTLEVFLDEQGHVRMANPDEELRSHCMLQQRAVGRPVTLVTGDLGMRLRADAHGLGMLEWPTSTPRTPSAEQRSLKIEYDSCRSTSSPQPIHIETAQVSNEIVVEELAKPTVLQTAVSCGLTRGCAAGR